MNDETITILCSGVALGVYIPALLIEYQLRKTGINTDLVVLENLLKREKRDKIPESKIAFHRSFKVALTGQKLARDIYPSLDEDSIRDMFTRWRSEKRRKFIVFSGFWIPVMDRYLREASTAEPSIELCHMDAAVSTSFRHYEVDDACYTKRKFFSWETKSMNYYLNVAPEPPVPYDERNNRFVIHGGGWGMGTYKDKISFLAENNIELDVIAYEERDIESVHGRNRYFMIDPEWRPWEKNNDNRHQFPPFGECLIDTKMTFRNKKEYPDVYDLIKNSRAIISKPGGSTLIDSFSSATPLIFLEPFGDYEEKNGLLWRHLNFGISFDDWIKTGFSIRVLHQLADNLLKARDTVDDYVAWYRRNMANADGDA